MFSLARFLLTILLPLLFLDVAQAACFPRHAFPSGWYDSWPRSRPVDCLFQGRLRATLGERRRRLDAWRDLDRLGGYRYRRDPFWQQRYYRDRRVGIYFTARIICSSRPIAADRRGLSGCGQAPLRRGGSIPVTMRRWRTGPGAGSTTDPTGPTTTASSRARARAGVAARPTGADRGWAGGAPEPAPSRNASIRNRKDERFQ